MALPKLWKGKVWRRKNLLPLFWFLILLSSDQFGIFLQVLPWPQFLAPNWLALFSQSSRALYQLSFKTWRVLNREPLSNKVDCDHHVSILFRKDDGNTWSIKNTVGRSRFVRQLQGWTNSRRLKPWVISYKSSPFPGSRTSSTCDGHEVRQLIGKTTKLAARWKIPHWLVGEPNRGSPTRSTALTTSFTNYISGWKTRSPTGTSATFQPRTLLAATPSEQEGLVRIP